MKVGIGICTGDITLVQVDAIVNAAKGNHMPLIDKDIRAYRENGAVVVRQAVNQAEIANMLRMIDRHLKGGEHQWLVRRPNSLSERYLWPTHDWMRRFCAETPLPEIAGRCMGGAWARLYFDHLFYREAGGSDDTPWHQDWPYWPVRGRQIVSVWVALTPCSPESSGLQFVRGSHNWGKMYRPVQFNADRSTDGFLAGNEAGEALPDIDAHPDKYDLLSWDMDAGDAIVFSAEAIHGAKDNAGGGGRRVAVSVRYLGQDAIWDPRPGTDRAVQPDAAACRPGEPPADDQTFPVVWRRTG